MRAGKHGAAGFVLLLAGLAAAAPSAERRLAMAERPQPAQEAEAGQAGRPPPPGTGVSGEGVIEAGVECPMIRSATGRLYAIAGGVARAELPAPGIAVEFAGVVQGTSFCMQGTPLSVSRLVPR